MEKVRCKFKIESITKHSSSKSEKQEDGNYKSYPVLRYSLDANPVYANGDPNHENSKFWEASPGGKFSLSWINPEIATLFEPGDEIYIDIIKANK